MLELNHLIEQGGREGEGGKRRGREGGWEGGGREGAFSPSQGESDGVSCHPFYTDAASVDVSS